VGCDNDHYLVVGKVRETLEVGRREMRKVDKERFNLKKLENVYVKNIIRLKWQRGAQVWETSMMMWI
jgi:hypothetical protein